MHRNENYTVVQVGDNWFSLCRLGNAVDIHIASRNVWQARAALQQVCEWVFDQYEWCEMIIGTSNKSGVIKLARRCGFVEFARSGNAVALAKVRT